MSIAHPHELHVFIDSDVLFAASATTVEYGASLVLLRMAEITLIQVMTSQQVITEVERNLTKKLPEALPTFQILVNRCLHIVTDPLIDDIIPYYGLANQKDLPILVAAIREQCPWLITFNVRHFQPGYSSVTVLRPGEFLLRVREHLSKLHGSVNVT